MRYALNVIRINACKTPDEFSTFVNQGELKLEAQLNEVVKRILELPALHFIGLTGPTCAGKTTAAKKLTAGLEKNGKRVHVISLDDFYHSKEYLHELALKKGRTELDYDSEETINIHLLSECVESLLEQKPTQLPMFNFRTGKREKGALIQLRQNDIVLFEGIQLLYPRIDKILSERACRSIFICPLTALEVGGESFLPNEIRLMRRLVRDYLFRNTPPEFTLQLWKSVRENEEKSIFPYVSKCSFEVDSTMPYGLGILKPHLEEILATVPKNSPFRKDADRIREQIQAVQEVPEHLIGVNSLYKEFV